MSSISANWKFTVLMMACFESLDLSYLVDYGKSNVDVASKVMHIQDLPRVRTAANIISECRFCFNVK